MVFFFGSEMFWVRVDESAMGVGDVRHLDLPGVLGGAPQPRGAPLLREICHHGQVEGHWTGENDGEQPCYYRPTFLLRIVTHCEQTLLNFLKFATKYYYSSKHMWSTIFVWTEKVLLCLTKQFLKHTVNNVTLSYFTGYIQSIIPIYLNCIKWLGYLDDHSFVLPGGR